MERRRRRQQVRSERCRRTSSRERTDRQRCVGECLGERRIGIGARRRTLRQRATGGATGEGDGVGKQACVFPPPAFFGERVGLRLLGRRRSFGGGVAASAAASACASAISYWSRASNQANPPETDAADPATEQRDGSAPQSVPWSVAAQQGTAGA